jgi:magnesium transporter
VSVPQELVERIRMRLEESLVGIGAHVAELADVDVADLVNELTLQEGAAVVAMLPVARAVGVLDQPTLRRRAKIVEQLDPGRAAALLGELSSDERTEIVRGMGQVERRRVLPRLSAATQAELEGLLQYPPHTAGGMMTTEFVRLEPGMTVGDALKHLRAVAREKESIYACYVLEPGTGRLLGAVSLRDLVMSEFDRPLTAVMRKKPITAAATDDREAVAHKIAKYNLLAVPVIEADGVVAGFVTVDDVIDVMIEEQTEDILRMAAVEPGALDKPYFDNPVWRVVRKRVGWLLLLFVGGTLTGTVLRHFEGQLSAVVALSFFIPMLIGTGGNAGAQTVMTVIRSLALGEIRFRDAWKVVLREATTGLTVGVMIAVAAFGQALLTGASWTLAATVALTMLAICLWSTAVGAFIPLVAHRFGLDPAVLSAPLITTLVDATGLVIYFLIAKVVLQL